MKTVAMHKLVATYLVLGVGAVGITSLANVINSNNSSHAESSQAIITDPVMMQQISSTSTIIAQGVAQLNAGQNKASVASLALLEESLFDLKKEMSFSDFTVTTTLLEMKQYTDRAALYTAKVKEEVSAWKSEESESLTENPMAVDYAIRAREQLDSIGGSTVKIVWSEDICGLEWAMGCVQYPDVSYMTLSPKLADLNDHLSLTLITHEYAHIVIGRADPAEYMMNNSTLLEVFPAEPNVNETLADCMTEVITGNTTRTYMDACTEEQLHLAENVWNGITP